jgi:hypothetical protein
MYRRVTAIGRLAPCMCSVIVSATPPRHTSTNARGFETVRQQDRFGRALGRIREQSQQPTVFRQARHPGIVA